MRNFFVVLGVLALVASGCGGKDTGSSSPVAKHSPSPAVAKGCVVKGYYPKTRKTLARVRPVVLYGTRVGLAPGTSQKGHGTLEPDEPTPHIGVTVDTPAGAVITPALRSSVAATISGASARKLPASVQGRWRLPTGHGNRAYLVYAGATLYQGVWSARICGEGMNDGSKVVTYRGTFTVVGRLRHGVARCHQAPTGSALNRRAIERACM